MKKGDHLVTSRTGYTHHGLYVGNGEVIHYTGGGSSIFSKGEIAITSLAEFSNGEDVSIELHYSRQYKRDKCVERAYRRLGENDYSVVFNNCEHFVNWCIEGEHSSSQVKNTVAATTAVSAARVYAVKQAEKKAAEVVASQVAKSMVSKSVGVGAGYLVGGSTVVATTTSTLLATATIASPVLAPVLIATGTAYVISKLWDEIFW